MTTDIVCTEAAARAAGLDGAPSWDELTSMASTIVAATGGAATPETDLARAVPLMAAAARQAQDEVARLRAGMGVALAALMAGRGMDCAELLTDLGAVEPHDSGGPEPIPSTWSTDPGQYPLDLGEET